MKILDRVIYRLIGCSVTTEYRAPCVLGLFVSRCKVACCAMEYHMDYADVTALKVLHIRCCCIVLDVIIVLPFKFMLT